VPFLEESKALDPLVVVSLLLEDPLAEFPEEEPVVPVVPEPDVPVVSVPVVPDVVEPDVLALPDTEAPVLADPETPVVAEPETPGVAEPEVPVVAEPEIPVEPFTPEVVLPFIDDEPLIPVEPFTPELVLPFIDDEPFKPVPAEPETLPDVAAVPLFKEEPVDTVPFIEPDVLAFIPAPEPPLFHWLKFILVLDPGIAVNTHSPVKSSLNKPCLADLPELFPAE